MKAFTNPSANWLELAAKHKAQADEDRFLKLQEVSKKTGKSKSAIYRDIENGTFPPPTKIGKKAIAWRLSVIEGWMEHVEKVEG
ncbi:MAG: AlpA family phage regulatory protein [Ketobacter sp.]|nr:MAG: AlpA family phage regulatory protein [Ketobacter sp.]